MIAAIRRLSRYRADDWLTPMLVKELREELRARSFVNVFVWVQALLFLSVVVALLSESKDGTELSQGVFWMCLTLPLLILLPLRGFQSFGKEIKADSLELIFLTDLTALQIVVGKWLALFVEGLLFIFALLPYVLLRYFLGGEDLISSFFALCAILAGSAFMIALTVGGSASARTQRSSFMFFITFGALGLTFVSSGGTILFDFMSRKRLPGWGELLPVFTLGPLFILLLLEMGAARIAPPNENHSFRKRLLGLLIIGTAFGLHVLGAKGSEVIAVLCALAVLPVCVGALCEKPRWLLSLYLPFVQLRRFRMPFGRLFYPGWHTGVFYTLITAGLVCTLFVFVGILKVPRAGLLWMAMCNFLLVPVPVTRFLYADTERPFGYYVAVHLFLAVAGVVVLILDPRGRIGPVTTFFPMMGLAAVLDPPGSRHSVEALMVAPGLLAVLCFGALLLQMGNVLAATKRAEDQARWFLRRQAEPELEAELEDSWEADRKAPFKSGLERAGQPLDAEEAGDS